jgi:hypothetical protein
MCADPRMRHFVALPHADQVAAIKQLANSVSPYVIAAATRLSVEEIKRIVGAS